MASAKKHTKDEAETLVYMIGFITIAFEENSEQDPFGEMFSKLNLLNEWRG